MRMEREYISTTETAKLIRKALKKAFPDIKFSVISEKYAGGSSIRVSYIDGPKSADIDQVVSCFSSKGFDGMIDMSYHKYHWLQPDGSVILAHSPGTSGSAGMVDPRENGRPHPDAKMVSFGSDYVFVNRSYSKAAIETAVSELEKDWGLTRPAEFQIIDSNFPPGSASFRGGNHKFNDDPRSCDYWQDMIHRKLRDLDF